MFWFHFLLWYLCGLLVTIMGIIADSEAQQSVARDGVTAQEGLFILFLSLFGPIWAIILICMAYSESESSFYIIQPKKKE